MSENREIARAAGLVSAFTLVSRFGGLIRDAVVGYYFGTGAAADAFFVAFRMPNLLRRFVAEGAMSTAFIPVFTEYWTNRTREEAIEAASALATIMAVGLTILTIAGMILAPLLTSLFAPGFVAEPGKFELTVALTRWTFPYILLISLVALCSGILNSLRHFAAPAMSPIFLNIAMIGAALSSPYVAEPVYTLAYGVLVGGVLQLLIQLPPLFRNGIRLRPLWAPHHEAVQRAARLMGPMVFGAAVYQINILVDTVLASVLPSGSVSYLWYADRVFEFPLGIFAVAIGTAALPSFSAQVARGEMDELRRSLIFSMRLTSFIVLPAATGLFVLAIPITSVLFERGAFAYPEAVLTARALSAFAVGLWPVSLARLLIPAFYAMHDTRTPVTTAAAAFVANATFSLLLMGPVAATSESAVADLIAHVTSTIALFDLRHAGLALSTSLAATVNFLLLLAALQRRVGKLGLRQLMVPIGRDLIASAAMIPAVWLTAGLVDWSQSGHLLTRTATLLAAVGSGVVAFAIVQLILGASELQTVWDLLQRRLSSRSNASS